MATIDDNAAQLNRTLVSLANGVANADPKIRQAFDRIVASQSALSDSYAETLRKSKALTKQEVDDALLRISRLKKVAEEEKNLNSQYLESMKKYQALTKLQDNKKRNEAADSYAATYKLHKAGLQKIKESADEREALERKVASRWTDTMRDTWKAQKDKLLSSDTMMRSMTEGYSALVESAATQMGEDLTTSFHTAMLGFKPTEFIKFQAEFRRTELAMIGGQESFIKGLDAGSKAYSTMMLKPGEASKAIAEQFQILATAGIRPVAEDASMFADTLKRVSAMTGKKASEINADLASITDDESTQTQLKMAATEEERRAIIRGTQAQYANSIALGMSSKQAIASATALNRLQTQTQKSRYIEAARIRALGGALGMGGQAAELASIRAKAPASLTAADKSRALEISAALSQKVTQMRGMGGAAAMNVEALSEGLKLDQQFGPDSPFNTTLANAVAPLKTDMHTASDKLIGIAHTAEQIYAAVANNPIISGTLSLGNILLTQIAWNTGGFTKLFGKVFGGGKGGAAVGTAEGVIAKGAPTIAKATGMLSKSLRILGPLGAAAGGIYEGYSEYQKTGKMGKAIGTGTGATTGALAGGALGTALIPIPVLGTMIGAAVGGWVGEKAGGWIGEKATGESDTQQSIAEDTAATNVSITDQLKKMDATNDLLKTISDNTTSSAEYMEKLLYVAMMSDKDKQAAATRLSMMKDNRFGSQYGYTM